MVLLFDKLRIKITLEGQMIKWSQIELVQAIISSFYAWIANN